MTLSPAQFFDLMRTQKTHVVVDDHHYKPCFETKGYTVTHFDDYDFQADNVVFLIITTFEYQQKLKTLWQNTQGIIVLLSIAKFGATPMQLQYTLERVLSADMQDVLTKRKQSYQLIESHDGELTLTAQKSKLRIELYDNIQVANFDEVLKSGWLYSIPEFFEASFVHTQEKCGGFNVNGHFYFDGLITVASKREILENQKEALNALMTTVVNGHEKYLIVEDNKIQELHIDGINQSKLLSAFNFEAGREIMEMSFGCNQDVLKKLDWRVNSVANEGAYGMHIALGMAQTAPHIDFISTELKLC
ncbi:MAG: hypothetical protein A3J38_02060 [Gammaproteobacteria bacterium RIFCSPHIGHO2_12_FULL_45_9]|nr:MAG: hypothetical protein A3J38_02060 [Gammaproteobacteria bacterium RIFCSPHIGHO2_12_FULL_45_9]